MPKVEVEESEFLATKATIDAVTGMLANPAARRLLLQARKTAAPNAPIPELDIQAPVGAALNEFQNQIAAERKALADQRAAEKAERDAEKAERAAEKERAEQARMIADFEANWTRQKASLRDQGWRDEGIEEIVKHAESRGIADLEIAAAHWEKLHPPPEPVTPNGSGSWGFMENNPAEDKFVQAMIASRGEDEGALQAEINASLRDFRQAQQGARR